MAENDNKEVVKEPEVKTPEVNPIEEQARAKGWKPQEEWTGSPDVWVDAKEFLAREPLFKRIEGMSQEVKSLRAAMGQAQQVIEDLKQHNARVEVAAYERALRDLKAEKRQALSEGEVERVMEIEDKIDELKEAKVQAQTPKQPMQINQPTIHPELKAWMDRNTWYTTDPELQDEATALGIAYKKRKGDTVTNQDVLDYVENKIKTMHPEKFRNPARQAPASVETEGRPARAKAQDDVQLSSEEEAVMKRLIRQGVMTEAEYKRQIKEVNERK